MVVRVEYLTDPDVPSSLCWILVPLSQDVLVVADAARAGLPVVRARFGAKGFRIVDSAGVVQATG